MIVLGLSGGLSDEYSDFQADMNDHYGHDAAACLIRDGELVAAVEEERLSRVKKTLKFPVNAVRACVDMAGVTPAEIDAVGYFSLEMAMDVFIKHVCMKNPERAIHPSRQLIESKLKEAIDLDLPADRLRYITHHVSHAMPCFVRSGMREALVVVMDGLGESQSISVYRGTSGSAAGSGDHLELLKSYEISKSLGIFYQTKIELLGYTLGDEYKVMGLAPYGNPDTYRDSFSAMYRLTDDGDYELSQENWSLLVGGFTPRRKGEDFTQQHKDFAASLQQTLETIALHVIGYWADRTGLRNLCFSGGVAQNSSLNGAIVRSGKFAEVFIHPASHDGGTAEGAALAAALQVGGPRYQPSRMRRASLGPALGAAAEIKKKIDGWGELVDYEQPASIVDTAAELLAGGAVLGWAHGRSEFGPRALGNRSILADARPEGNKERINAMVKKREAYRPFAPVVTAAAAEDYFEIPRTRANYDFMSFVVNVRADKRAELGAVTHTDGTARVQVIEPVSNERFHALVEKFGEVTGVPVLLNTSFNNNAEPIVQDVHDVMTCFLTTGLDFLVIEDFLVRRRRGRELALDSLVPRLRPVTHLAKRVRWTQADEREIIHEVALRYPGGPSARTSAAAFALLEAADGRRTLGELAGLVGGLDDDIRQEICTLWQGRYFTLRPAAA